MDESRVFIISRGRWIPIFIFCSGKGTGDSSGLDSAVKNKTFQRFWIFWKDIVFPRMSPNQSDLVVIILIWHKHQGHDPLLNAFSQIKAACRASSYKGNHGRSASRQREFANQTNNWYLVNRTFGFETCKAKLGKAKHTSTNSKDYNWNLNEWVEGSSYLTFFHFLHPGMLRSQNFRKILKQNIT